MTRRIKLMLAAAAPLLSYHVLVGWGHAEAEVGAQAARPDASAPVAVDPQRTAFFGDLHLHTTNSFDAYMLMGTRTTPEEAYRFARGDTIDYLGQPIRKKEPLDFLAVTDHAESMGVMNQLDDAKSGLSLSEIGRLAREGGIENLNKVVQLLRDGKLDKTSVGVTSSTWRREMDAANTYYTPGRFTTFIAYEWGSSPNGQNLHRNVIFRGDKAPAPFTGLDSQRPEDLWAWLSKIRTQGYEALAIPHNANASNGLMYDWTRLYGGPIDEAYAQLRATNEPLIEVAQNKGTSETHPVLSANDEFAGFEIYDRLLSGTIHSREQGSYWRDGLGRGLVIGARIGVNPFKDGAVGASDYHSGLSVQSEADQGSTGRANLGGGKLTLAQVKQTLANDPSVPNGLPPVILLSSGALTGVWAESNTREAIYAAFRRKETFATSGTRIKLRFFGGWAFDPALIGKRDWVKSAYAGGVPMGADLPATGGRAPSFAVQAVKDPGGANLDRIQIIKVWLEAGEQKERVFDVAWTGKRKIDPKTGKLPAVGDTVDLKSGRYTNDIGAAQLAKVWKDPTFDARQSAVYYVRVLEIPTPRWTTLRAIENGLPLPKVVPSTIQERAWSSPIWFTPAKRN